MKKVKLLIYAVILVFVVSCSPIDYTDYNTVQDTK